MVVGVQKRFACVTRVAHLRDRPAHDELLAYPDDERSLPEMSEQDVSARATQDHMVAWEIVVIHLWNLHVRQAIDCRHHLTGART